MQFFAVFSAILLFSAAGAEQEFEVEVVGDDGIVYKTQTGPTPSDPDKEAPEVKWSFREKNQTCIILSAKIKLTFKYSEMNTSKTITKVYDVPAGNDSVVDEAGSTCGNGTSPQVLKVDFFKLENSSDSWSLTFTFVKDKDSYNIANTSLYFIVSDVFFPNNSDTHPDESCYKANINDGAIGNKNSYKCGSESSIKDFIGMNNQTNLTLMQTWDFQTQAFRTSDDHKFSDAVHCTADTSVSNIVPIVVGAALAGLVLIVLIAYLIGRARNKRGYESV